MYKKEELENTIHNESCLELMKKIPDNTIDLIVTDPPYPVISWWNKKTFANWFASSVLRKNDWKIFKHNDIKIQDYIGELYRILKDWTHAYIMVNALNLENFMTEIRKVWFKIHTVLIWDKWNKVLWWRYMKNIEYIIFVRKWKAKRIKNIWTSHILQHTNPRWKIHHTEKPSSLWKELIENSTGPWDLVYDPFAWVGWVWVACEESWRKYVLSELSKNFSEIIKLRLINKETRSEIKEKLDDDMYLIDKEWNRLYPDE